MHIIQNKSLFFILAFLFATALYWPLLNGTPIWDDWPFWFQMQDSSYLDFWSRYTWPLSNTVQRFLLGIFDKNYLAYHCICLGLHFVNSFLVYVMAKKINFSSPFWLFLFFLLSPVCAISIGWLIQIKTLLAFMFGIASFITFLNFFKNKKWIFLSWVLFFLSLAAKSTLITLPLIMIIIGYKKLPKLHYLFLVPFFLISFWSANKILRSPVTQEAVKSLTAENVNGPIPFIKINDENSGKAQKVDANFLIKSLYYYFWQPINPFDNAPVKGPNHESPIWIEYAHLLFLLCMLGVFWKDKLALYLVAGHLLLLPYLGIIPAPYMIISWVSDQHLYAVLPAFLAFWISLLKKIKLKHNWIILLLILGHFSYRTREASYFYKNEFAFYEASLHSNPANLAIAYNLAFAHLTAGQYHKSLKVLEDTYKLGQYFPEIKEQRFYNYIIILYMALKFPEIKTEP